jgi:hypothetical protein
MTSRRDLLGALAASASAFGSRPLAKTKPTNLFNGDSCTYFYNPELWQPEGGSYSAKAIHRYVDLLADNGVDAFLINPNTQVAWYPSKKLPTVLDGYKRGDREFFRGHAVGVGIPPNKQDAYLDHQVDFFNLYQDLIDAGVDWLAETSKACRRRAVSPWVSVRMNDMHGAGNPTGSHFNCALFKNPRFRLEGRPLDPSDNPVSGWAGLNYEMPEVRSFMLSHIREYLELYDFEGMELDWLRNPLCCNPPARKAEQDMMTAWLREVRRLTNIRARRLGKPVPLGLRIPGNLAYMRSIGIDVVRLAREHVIDFIGFSNFWQTSWDMPYDELRDQLGSHVAVYGVVEDAPNWVRAYAPSLAGKPISGISDSLGIRYMSGSPQMVWANAAGKLAMGVDAVEQFNFFCTDQVQLPGLRSQYSALRGIDRLEHLRGKPKHYCLQSPYQSSASVWELPEAIPITMEAKSRREFRLSMCQEPAGSRLLVQVVVTRTSSEPKLGVSVNGCWPTFQKTSTQQLLFPVGPYTEHLEENQAYNFELSGDEIREGWNRILIMNNARPKDAPDGSVHIVSVELGVHPPANQ